MGRWSIENRSIMQNYNTHDAACHHLGSSKSHLQTFRHENLNKASFNMSQTFQSTPICRDSKIQCLAAPSKTYRNLSKAEIFHGLVWGSLIRWVNVLSRVRDWRLGVHCTVPRPRWLTGFRFVRIFGSLRCTRVVRRVRWRFRHVFEFCLDFTIFIPEIEASQKIVWRYQCEISINIKKTNQRWITNHRPSHRSHALSPWPINTEVATHWELLVLLEGSGQRSGWLEKDENYDKSDLKQNFFKE